MKNRTSKVERAKEQLKVCAVEMPELFSVVKSAAAELMLWEIDEETTGYQDILQLILAAK